MNKFVYYVLLGSTLEIINVMKERLSSVINMKVNNTSVKNVNKDSKK